MEIFITSIINIVIIIIHHRLADSIATDTHCKSWKIQSKEYMLHKNLLFSYCADPSDPIGPLVGAKVKYF